MIIGPQKRRSEACPNGLARESAVPGRGYCTLAVTEALLLNVKVQVLVLLPLLEQAPDQIASRLLLTRSVMAVPALNVADRLDEPAR